MKFMLCPQSRLLSQTLISVDREMVPREGEKEEEGKEGVKSKHLTF